MRSSSLAEPAFQNDTTVEKLPGHLVLVPATALPFGLDPPRPFRFVLGGHRVHHSLDPVTGADQAVMRLVDYQYTHMPSGFAASPDGHRVFYDRWISRGADLMLLAGFRYSLSTSAPSGSGVCRYGVANVLSTTSRASGVCARVKGSGISTPRGYLCEMLVCLPGFVRW